MWCTKLAKWGSIGSCWLQNVLPQGGQSDRESLQRFRLEAKATAQLHHPNIVQIFDIGEQDSLPYFSLEFVDGGSLAQKLRGQPQPPRQAVLMVEMLARAIAVAHARGIIHRDLKPANVLLTIAGQPKITDFGLAKLLGEKSRYTMHGAILGTPSYMAPEQARGQTKLICPATDIFSLGAILYEMLTGRPPFQGATVFDTMQQLIHDRAKPPRQLRPELPRDLERIVLKCLEKIPPDRYTLAGELADDLRRFVNGQEVLARPKGIFERGLRWVKPGELVPCSALSRKNKDPSVTFRLRLWPKLSEFPRAISISTMGMVHATGKCFLPEPHHRGPHPNKQDGSALVSLAGNHLTLMNRRHCT